MNGVFCFVNQIKMENPPKTLTLAELIRLSRPLTGTSSLNHSRSIKPHSSKTQYFNPKTQYPNPKTLNSLNYPTIFLGTLTLPTPATSSPLTSFSFTHGVSTVPCDILGFHPCAIGAKILVTAWNFIPFEKKGFLEIISWEFAGVSFNDSDVCCLSISSLDSGNNDVKARYCVKGGLESVSPVSVVPCSTGSSSKSTNVSGFLVKMLLCGCKLCNTKDSVMGLSKDHSFLTPVIVYFCGYNASLWYPVIVKLVGSVVKLEHLKKKIVFIGEDESQLMYVTTEKSLLYVPNLGENWVPVSKTAIKGKGECGSYSGTVTGIYMKGMVVELDQKVFLVVTDQLIALPLSVRVGAIVSIRNVHFVNPNFPWTKLLILGACFKTSVCLESFSPYKTGCRMHSQSQSLLGNFLDSLAYSARLWVLLLVSSFRKKFVGILSEQEILGSKHKKGLVQSFATSHLPSSVFQSRHGLFREYCKHESCGCNKEPNNVQFKLVSPISNVITHCNTTWMELFLEQDADSELTFDCDQSSIIFCDGVYYRQKFRSILQSTEIGVALLGLIKVYISTIEITTELLMTTQGKEKWKLEVKVSPFSGRLQLIDSTGSIDVLLPDFNSTLDVKNIYEVNDFTLVREGTPGHEDHLEILSSVSFSCRSIFTGVQCKRTVEGEMYVLYHFRDTKLVDHPSNPTIKDSRSFVELQSGMFHLILVTHKYLFKQKFPGEQAVAKGSSVFAEVFLLPWDLDIIGKDEHICPSKLSAEFQKESVLEYSNGNYQEFVPSKRLKIDQGPCGEHILSCLKSGNISAATYGLHGCTGLSSSPEIPCSVTYRSINNQLLSSPATLYGSNSFVNVGPGKKPQAHKLLLEFKSESICKYQLLKVGSYYIIKHHKDDMLCSLNATSHANSSKVVISSTTHLWSSLFFSNQDKSLANCGPQNELQFPRSNYEFPQMQPDVTIHLSNHDLDFLRDNLERLDGSIMNPLVSLKEVAKFSEMTGLMQSPENFACSYQLPEGDLISFHGKVLFIHNSECNANSSLRSDFRRGQIFNATKRFCIHVLVDHHPVRIFCSSNSYAYPVGFGPGCSADFHRILLMSGRNEFIMTPSSYIEIRSILLAAEEQCDKSNKSSVPLDLSRAVSVDNIPSIMISDVMQHVDCKTGQFHCRIVTICVMLMEKKRKAIYSQIRDHSRLDVLHIPLAGFVMDDGSSSCCFWTNNEMAATLLRLNEKLPLKMSRNHGVGDSDIIIHHLAKIVKKHGVVTVRNYGSAYDSTSQDLIVSVSSNAVFNSSAEEFLKLVILNACCCSSWTVIGNLMDSHAVRKLEKRLAEMDMTIHPMQNIWVQEVHHINPLAEARRLMQELMS